MNGYQLSGSESQEQGAMLSKELQDFIRHRETAKQSLLRYGKNAVISQFLTGGERHVSRDSVASPLLCGALSAWMCVSAATQIPVFAELPEYAAFIHREAVSKLKMDALVNTEGEKESELASDTVQAVSKSDLFVSPQIQEFFGELTSLLLEEEEFDREGYALRPTRKAFEQAWEILQGALGNKRSSGEGTIMTDDNGGIRLEWSSGKRWVNVVFAPNEDYQNYIYFKDEEKDGVDYEVTADRLAYWLEQTAIVGQEKD